MKLLLTFFLFFPLTILSQEALTLSEVIQVSNTDKNELFIRGREWFNNNFKSSKDVLQISDKETGELLGKGIMKVNYTWRYMGEKQSIIEVSFQMNIWVKDNRYKYELTNFNTIEDGMNINFGLITISNETNVKYSGFNEKKLNEMYLSIKQGTITKANQLIKDLKHKMEQESSSSDW